MGPGGSLGILSVKAMADQEHPKPLFAAIPLQAIGDRRLSAAHFQVLAAIAWHDQFGANGIGCYASLEKLAWETRLSKTTISECTGELEGFGFLTKTRHPLNRRTKVYSLIYEGNPRILPETGNCPSSHGAEGTKVPGSGNDRGATLRVENSQVPEAIEQTDAQYIPRSGREKEKPPTGNTESPPRACAPEALARAAGDGDSASATEEKNARAREEKIDGGGDGDATRRARLCLGGTHAAGGDDSTVEREEKKEREAKKSLEALASKAGRDPSEFESHTWCAWINLTYGYDRNTAAEMIIGWLNEARQDRDRVIQALCEAFRFKPPDIENFMAERLGAPQSAACVDRKGSNHGQDDHDRAQ